MIQSTLQYDFMTAATGVARKACDLTVVMPCLNEAETLEVCIRKALNAIAELDIEGEVLIADNGSTDGSQEIAKRAGARVIAISAKGYGNAIRGGILEARGRYVIMGDSDDSYDFSAIAPFVEKLQAGADLVMGCRMPWGKGRIEAKAMPWKHRWIGNPALTFIGKIFFKAPTNDFHCGLRGFTREAFERMDLRTTGMEFASEMVVKATLKKMRVEEVPITLHRDGRSRAPHLRSWRDGWRHLRFMLLYCPTWLFLVPAICLGLLGMLGSGLLLSGPFSFRNVSFDTNTLLVCAMAVVVSSQLAYFALFARLFAAVLGMLPRSQRLSAAMRWFNLERGLIASGALALSGASLLVVALMSWREVGFGPLSYPDSLRQVIPAITLVTLGVQAGFASFLLSLFQVSEGQRSVNS